MDTEKIFELLSVIMEKDIDEVRNLDDEAILTDMGLDSLRFIDFIVDLEIAFNIEINDSDLLLRNFATKKIVFETIKKYFDPPSILKKVLVLDCDNVLWHGVSGEEEVKVNENNLKFQKELVRLYENGVLLCLCSRNEVGNIEKTFQMPDMLLKPEHIACSRINFNDKARSINEIAAELNLLTNSFVFADDSDYEIGLINALLPEVETLKVDYTNDGFINAVISHFGSVSASDLNRTQLFKEQKEREKEKHLFKTVEEYNESLKTVCFCGEMSSVYAERIAELSQRTNQFNLSNARYTVDEVNEIINKKETKLFAVSASDKYGDMGIVGVAVVREGESVVIESFMLSCRVFGRGFEINLLDYIKEFANDKALYGSYVSTEKNRRFAEFYLQNGVKICE